MLGEGLALLAAFCWALGASMYKVSLRRANPIGLNFVRSIPATILLFLIAFLTGRIELVEGVSGELLLWVFAASAVAWVAGDSLYFAGLKLIGVSRTVPLSYSYPLFLIPLSLWLLGEQPTLRILIGSLAIVASIWLVSRSLGSSSGDPRGFRSVGVVSAILAAILWAVGVAAFKQLMFFIDPVLLAFLRLLLIIPVLGLVSLLTPQIRGTFRRLSRRELILALAGGTCALGLGDLIYLIGLDLTQANVAGALAATTPIFSGVIAIGLLKERVTWEIICGIALVTFGAILLSL